MVGLSLPAVADNVVDSLPDLDIVLAGGDAYLLVGESVSVEYKVQPTSSDGLKGCNADDGSAATINVLVPAHVQAIPSILVFAHCHVGQSVVYSVDEPGIYTIDVVVSDAGAGTYDPWPARIVLHVSAPPPAPALDSTPPFILPVLSPAAPDGLEGWYRSPIALSWNVSDPESAIAGSTGCDAMFINHDTPDLALSCAAWSAGGSARLTITVRRDATAPVVEILAASDQFVGAPLSYAANASDALSGVGDPACVAPAIVGVGANLIHCKAADRAGNPGAASASAAGVYQWLGFQPPLAGRTIFKAGSTIPVKFRVGYQIDSVVANIEVVKLNNKPTGTDLDPGTTNPASPGTLFRYDPIDDQYIFNLGTKGWSSGNYKITAKLDDGRSYNVMISLR